MTTKPTDKNALDARFPTAEEQGLIAKGVFISKIKYNDQNIQPTYHRWRDVWADNLQFTVNNLNQEVVWRAMAISLPMYFLDDPNVTELTYRGYVYGIHGIQGAEGQIFELSQIAWKIF